MSGLAELVRPAFVRIDPRAATAEAIIRALAVKLVHAGDARPTLPDAAVEREALHPTGLLLSPTGPNAALPHADREHVIRPAIAIATLVEPVDFRRMDAPEEPVPVRLIILLALSDPDGQLAALREVGAMLQQPERVARILDARDAGTLIAALAQEA